MKPIPEPIKSFIADAAVCRVATVRPSGDPHIIPVCPAYDGDSTVFIDIARDGVSAKAIAANSSVTVVIDEYDDDWSKLRAVILRCSAEPLAGDELLAAWEFFRTKFPQGEAIGWAPRLSLGLRIQSWTEWGITHMLGTQAID